MATVCPRHERAAPRLLLHQVLDQPTHTPITCCWTVLALATAPSSAVSLTGTQIPGCSHVPRRILDSGSYQRSIPFFPSFSLASRFCPLTPNQFVLLAATQLTFTAITPYVAQREGLSNATPPLSRSYGVLAPPQASACVRKYPSTIALGRRTCCCRIGRAADPAQSTWLSFIPLPHRLPSPLLRTVQKPLLLWSASNS